MMHWPQWTYASFYGFVLFVQLVAATREDTSSAWKSFTVGFICQALTAWILYMGGFFG